MNKFLKKINALAIVAMLVGGGFAFSSAQNIKKTSVNAKLFAMENGNWVNIDNLAPGQYSCSGTDQDCTALFTEENPGPSSTPVEDSETKGIFARTPN